MEDTKKYTVLKDFNNPEETDGGPKIGDVIELPEGETTDKLVNGGFVEIVADEEDKDEEENEGSEEEDVGTVPAKVLMYKGKKIITSAPRVVNGVTHQEVKLEDGTTFDLSEEEYKTDVSVAE